MSRTATAINPKTNIELWHCPNLTSVPPLPPLLTQMQVGTCTEGEWACPPEDCGGIDAYRHLLQVLRRPYRDRERRQLIDWLGEEFDVACFDLDSVNEELHELPLNADPFPM